MTAVFVTCALFFCLGVVFALALSRTSKQAELVMDDQWVAKPEALRRLLAKAQAEIREQAKYGRSK